MNKSGEYDKLLKYMYDEFNRSSDAPYIQVFIERFERSQGVSFGDAQNKIGAVLYFLENRLIDAVDLSGNRITSPREAYNSGRMQPTEEGRNYLQRKRIGTANAVAAVSGTFFGKLIKSILGK